MSILFLLVLKMVKNFLIKKKKNSHTQVKYGAKNDKLSITKVSATCKAFMWMEYHSILLVFVVSKVLGISNQFVVSNAPTQFEQLFKKSIDWKGGLCFQKKNTVLDYFFKSNTVIKMILLIPRDQAETPSSKI